MSALDTARALIKKHEGLRLKPYKCTAGKTTVGYGRNLDDVGISAPEALIMLENDIHNTVNELTTCLHFWDNLTPNRQAVFIDMCFNLGISRFLKFKNMILAAKTGNVQETARQMKNSRWYKQVGNRADTLIELYLKG